MHIRAHADSGGRRACAPPGEAGPASGMQYCDSIQSRIKLRYEIALGERLRAARSAHSGGVHHTARAAQRPAIAGSAADDLASAVATPRVGVAGGGGDCGTPPHRASKAGVDSSPSGTADRRPLATVDTNLNVRVG